MSRAALEDQIAFAGPGALCRFPATRVVPVASAARAASARSGQERASDGLVGVKDCELGAVV